MKNNMILILLFFMQAVAASTLNILVVSVGRFPPKQGTAVLNHITGLIDLNCFVKIFTRGLNAIINPNKDIIDYKLIDRTIIKNIPDNLEHYDVILAETGSGGNNFIKYQSKDTKLVVCFRGHDVGGALMQDPHCYDELFTRGDFFLPVCEAFKNELIEHGCPKEKIEILHSAIDCDIFYYKKRIFLKNEPIKIISICRLVPKKGLFYAIDAISQLIKKGFNIQYTIVGEGILYDSLNALVLELGMQDNIHLVGRKSITEVVTYLHNNHIFLLSPIIADDGDEEGIPNAAKEAMACGLPVILTDHSGNKELVEHNISGLLVQQKSVEQLKDALEYLIQNKKLWNIFGKAGRKKIEKDFEKKKLSKKLYNILKKVAKNDTV